LRINEIMTSAVETIEAGDTLQRAASKMDALDVGILLVREHTRIVGVLTDRDIALRAAAKGRDPTRVKARDAMTTGLAYCYEDQEVEAAAALMEYARVRRLPVFTREDELTGIIALADIARARAARPGAGWVLAGLSRPTRGEAGGSPRVPGRSCLQRKKPPPSRPAGRARHLAPEAGTPDATDLGREEDSRDETARAS
jgi:CBS domain-containing protein